MNPSLRQLILSEPFRVLFPMGMLIAILSVSLWPLHSWGWVTVYPSLMHARTLMLGFVGGAVIGFFCTAYPRLIGVKGLSAPQFIIVMLLWLGSQIAYFANAIAWGDGISLALWTLIPVSAALNLRRRTDCPPPGFILVAAGLLSLWCALALRVIAWNMGEAWSGAYVTSRVLMYEAFPTLLILGVAPFFFPKIMGGPAPHSFPESRTLPVGWVRPARWAIAAVLVSLLGYLLKASHEFWGSLIAAIAVIAYAVKEIPLWVREPECHGAMAWGLTLGMISLLLGSMAPLLSPALRLGLYHLLAVGGVSLILFIVSIRVTCGHGGVVHQTAGWHLWIVAIGMLLPVAAVLRISADLWTQLREANLFFAAVALIFSVGIWLVKMGPLLWQAETVSQGTPTETEAPNTSELPNDSPHT